LVKGVRLEGLTYGLPGGGRIEVTDATMVPMGDVRAYRQLTYTHDGGNGQPACRIVFEVRNGAPVCANFSLSSVAQIAVRAKDLRAFKLDELRDDVYAYVGVFTPNPAAPGQWMLRVGRGSYHQDRKHAEQAARRRKVTRELLQKVAKVHTTAPEGTRLEAVKAAFQVQERQALRYIAEAKEKGLIDG
jgi:hypothetical protein